ncbi:FAD-dependent oxidoreductase [Undibacterium sp.]|uniref:FAD-dependent oxidoreductase n=1 Tax=Undibacterium sp. TaxID=1914977 RepID=UPI002730D351|nr:FAD-dependent oxidoreductase [Undibacterium sp.]MDP1978306.1 polyprenyl synthetase family protein [Undibacterium sp.]
MKQTRVLIAGAGIAGLTAAHELAERGYLVTVVEALAAPGGKSRSIPVEGSATAGQQELPGEHGFRFFPGFYRHIPDTMARIPCVLADGSYGSVADNLAHTTRTLALSKKGRWEVPNQLRSSSRDAASLLSFLYDLFVGSGVDVPREDMLHYVRCVFTMLTSSDERRFGEFENISAWDYFQAPSRSEAYQKYVINAVTRTLVACRAADMSARSNVVVGIQLLSDIYRSCADRVLNGPTSEVWIAPWVTHLQHLGVEFIQGVSVENVLWDGDAARALQLSDGTELAADHFILALPLEALQSISNEEMLARAPSLARLDELKTEWMNGILFYLGQDIELNHGHTIFLDAPWALTSLCQQRFWPRGLKQYSDGTVRGILSVCISDFDAPGEYIRKPAKDCTPAEIQEEVWQQILAHLAPADRAELEAAVVIACSIDPSLRWTEQGMQNDAPLFVNTAGSWAARPEVDIGISNLFVSGDFVRTATDVATMESANESARHAVNRILDLTASSAARCQLFPLEEPTALTPLKVIDRLRFEAGLPHLLDLVPVFSGETMAWLGGMTSRVAEYSVKAGDIVRQLGWDQRLPEFESRAMRFINNLSRGVAPVSKWASNAPDSKSGTAEAQTNTSGVNTLINDVVGSINDKALADDLDKLRARLISALDQTDKHFREYGASHQRHLIDGVLADSLFQSGKRLRASCALLCSMLMRRFLSEEAVQVAIITESIHAATLLHDDIIDEADQRRGHPTAWKKYGVGAGVLAGNLLVSRAVRSLYRIGYNGLADDLFEVIESMIAAESDQLSGRRNLEACEQDYLRIIDGKTAGLFAWSCRAGATVGGCNAATVNATANFGRHMGLAFQLIDDVIDLAPDTDDTGKTRYTDLSTGLLTYPLLLARQRDPQGFDVLAANGFADAAEVSTWLVANEALEDTRAEAARQIAMGVEALLPVRHSAAKAALIELARASTKRLR